MFSFSLFCFLFSFFFASIAIFPPLFRNGSAAKFYKNAEWKCWYWHEWNRIHFKCSKHFIVVNPTLMALCFISKTIWKFSKKKTRTKQRDTKWKTKKRMKYPCKMSCPNTNRRFFLLQFLRREEKTFLTIQTNIWTNFIDSSRGYEKNGEKIEA